MMILLEALRDWRFGARSLRRTPVLTCVAIATLVVGISSITTAFSFIDAVYFKALPYNDADRIAAISLEDPRQYSGFSSIPWALTSQLLGADLPFQRLTVFRSASLPAVVEGQPVQLATVQIDSSFVELMSVGQQLGRWPDSQEVLSDAPVVVIADELWRTRFAADPRVLGQAIMVRGRIRQIIGVAPAGFAFPTRTRLWIPISTNPSLYRDASDNVQMLGKLGHGVTRLAAENALSALMVRFQERNDSLVGKTLVLRAEMLDRGLQGTGAIAGLFLGVTAAVLLLTCSNVANLLLVRSADREVEMAIRTALGAGRARLLRQVLGEGFLLALVAGTLGTLASFWEVRIVLSLVPVQEFPSWLRFGVDLRIAVFAVLLMVTVTVLVGLLPARVASRTDLTSLMKGGGRSGSRTRGAGRIGRRGAVVQLGLAVVLFMTAVLMVESYERLSHHDFGYPAHRIISVTPGFDDLYYSDNARRMRYSENLASRLSSLPQIQGVALRGPFVRLSGAEGASTIQAFKHDERIFANGDTTRSFSRGIFPAPRWFVVSDSFFPLMRLNVVRGRAFIEGDRTSSLPVAVLSRRVARALWGSADPLGKTIRHGADGADLTVVGVVNDIKDVQSGSRGLSALPRPDIYLSDRQASSDHPDILAFSVAPPEQSIRAALDLSRQLDPLLPILRAETLADDIDGPLLAVQVVGEMFTYFAASALILAVIGIYGVIAHGVTRRSREIGIRISLGATATNVVSMIVWEGLRFATLGILAGTLASLLLSKPLRVFLFEATPLDPATYAPVAILFVGVALLACYIPARKAARTDPMEVLRHE